jgi:hypothetical protein
MADSRSRRSRPRTADSRCQHKARFIEKNQRGVPLSSRLGNDGKTDGFPDFDVGFVSFAGFAARFLGRPVQAGAEKPAYVVVMKRNAKMAVDQLSNPCTGPQLGRPAVGLGPLQEESLQATVLFGRQARCRTVVRFGSQAVCLLNQGEPAVNRRTVDA